MRTLSFSKKILLTGLLLGCSVNQVGAYGSLEIALALNWRSADNLCHGYFYEPDLNPNHLPILSLDQSQTTIRQNEAHFYFKQDDLLKGNVQVNQTGRQLNSDVAHLLRDPKTHRITRVKLSGHVRVQEKGHLLIGKTGQYHLSDHTGVLHKALYRMQYQSFERKQAISPSEPAKSETTTAWGEAKSLHQTAPQHFYLQHCTYSTCSPKNALWHLQASRVNLNQTSGRGEAWHTFLYFKDIPVFYWPYINFPIDNRRQTGWLYPSITGSGVNGFDYVFPFYWNIAPNADLTIYPHLLNRRGVFVENIFRYLFPNDSGQVDFGLLPHDRSFPAFQAETHRLYPTSQFLNKLDAETARRSVVSWQNHWQPTQNLSSDIDYEHVSDDYLLKDLHPLATENDRQLPETVNLHYQDPNWNLLAALSRYQTLQPIGDTPYYYTYARLPDLQGAYTHAFNNGLSFSLQTQYDRFVLNEMQPSSATVPVEGQRVNFMPVIDWPLQAISGFVDTTVQFPITQYQLTHQLTGRPSTITRVLPMFSEKAGLYFERYFHWLHHAYQQTLEPTVQYLYVPYRDQSMIPVFDANLPNTDYSGMFSLNRFSGIDRIGDANQVNVGVTSRLLHAGDGSQLLSASLGGILYLKNPRVETCTTPGCENTPGESTDLVTPDLLGNLTYQLTKHMQLIANSGYSTRLHQVSDANVYLSYFKDAHRLFNLGYNYTANGTAFTNAIESWQESHIETASISTMFPLTNRWLLVGSLSRNVNRGYWQSWLYGIEYDTCCLAFRVLEGRQFNDAYLENVPQFDHMILFQLELKGLGAIGPSSVTRRMQEAIPNYAGDFIDR